MGMKRLTQKILLLCLIVVSFGCAQTDHTQTDYTLKSDGELPISQQALSIKKAELFFNIKPEKQFIEAKSVLTLYSSKTRNVIGLNLDNNFIISEILINNSQLNPTLYLNTSGLLLINLPQPMSEEIVVSVAYEGKPRVAPRAPWDGGFVWGKTPSKEHWIATAVQGEGCDLFWACIDYSNAEPEQLIMHIEVPNNLVAAANGRLRGVTEKDSTKVYHWESNTAVNNYGVALNIGPYEVINKTFKSHYQNEIPIQFFHLPENKAKAERLVEELVQVTHFFEQYVGPYPFADDKLGIVETPHLGMEHQTINAYGNGYKVDKFGFDWLLHHELAHEWFANQMTHINADHLWLHEGFGAYMQALYAEHLHGEYAYMTYMHRFRLGTLNKTPIVQNKLLSVDEVYEAKTGPGPDIYSKASWVLHTLRELIGDEAFFEATTNLVYGRTDPKPGNFKPLFADTNDFVMAVNKATEKDYQWFFDVYLYQAELPKVKQQTTENGVMLSWEVKNNIPFPMPLEISINSNVKTLDLSSPQNIKLEPFDRLIIDPNSKVLKHEPYVEAYREFNQSSKK